MFKVNCDINFDSFTIIVPSVSVGNVGQFAADLIITSLDMKKIATVWDPAIVPVIGGDPYNSCSETLMTSCELYANIGKAVAVLQIRSPLVAKDSREFLKRLVQFFSQYSLSKLIILTSSYSAEKHNILSAQFRYLKNDFLDVKDNLDQINWIDYKTEDSDVNISIHGGGFAKKLFGICSENNMPCLLLFKYCSEGDNIPDALEMVTYLNKWINVFRETNDSINFTYPSSWNLCFGSPPPKEMF